MRRKVYTPLQPLQHQPNRVYTGGDGGPTSLNSFGVSHLPPNAMILGMRAHAMLKPNQPAHPAVPSVFPGRQWQQVLERDATADGQFVYAVKSTKIFCRPSCPSRRPTRKNVAFFPTAAAAEQAG